MVVEIRKTVSSQNTKYSHDSRDQKKSRLSIIGTVTGLIGMIIAIASFNMARISTNRTNEIEIQTRLDKAWALMGSDDGERFIGKSQALNSIDMAKLAKAEKELRLVLDLDSKNSVGYRYLGVCMFKQGRITEAIRAYSNSIYIEPTVEAHSNLGIAFRNINRIEESINEHKIAIKCTVRVLT